MLIYNSNLNIPVEWKYSLTNFIGNIKIINFFLLSDYSIEGNVLFQNGRTKADSIIVIYYLLDFIFSRMVLRLIIFSSEMLHEISQDRCVGRPRAEVIKFLHLLISQFV